MKDPIEKRWGAQTGSGWRRGVSLFNRKRVKPVSIRISADISGTG